MNRIEQNEIVVTTILFFFFFFFLIFPFSIEKDRIGGLGKTCRKEPSREEKKRKIKETCLSSTLPTCIDISIQ